VLRVWKSRPSSFGPLAAAAVALGLLAPSAALAEAPPVTTSSALTPQLAELATPAVRAQPLAAQAEAVGLPAEGPGGLIRQDGRVVVEAHFDSGALAAIPAAEAAGAELIDQSREYETLVLSVPPADLPAIAQLAGVVEVEPALSARVAAVGSGGAAAAAVKSNGLCEGGSVITQGLEQLNVAAMRNAFGARGAGKTIAVISDSFDSATVNEQKVPVPTHAFEDEVSNDLPGPNSTCSGQQEPVRVIAEDPPGQKPSAYTDEGRAMLQVVHDLAPQAKLAFATGEPSEISYAKNIEKLAAPVSDGGAGADVIVDDLVFGTEPYFQDGPVAVAIQRVTEKGVLYFTAAGNDNLFNAAGDEISSWEAPEFRGSTTCNAKVLEFLDDELASEGKGPYEPDCMDFDPGPGVDTEFGITVEPKSPALDINLQWAEPFYGVKSSFFAFIVGGSGAGEQILGGGGDNVLGIRPGLAAGWENETGTSQNVRLVIARCSAPKCSADASKATNPRIKFSILEDGFGVSETEYPKSAGGDIVGPVIYGHRGSTAATTVAAVDYLEGTAPKQPEPYSSRGPVTHYFEPVIGTAPAKALGAPEVISKPDITATDCASTTFFEQLFEGSWHFCGTSEAAEHAATIAALMQQTEPLAPRSEILSRMTATTTKFSVVNGPEAVGAGMVNAVAATAALGGSRVDNPPSTVVPTVKEREEAEKAPGPTPVVTITKGPAALGNESRPTFEWESSVPATFSCQVDGGAQRPCASPYVVPTALGDGNHGFAVTATATAARGRSAPSRVYGFTVDTARPKATIAGRPAKVIRTRAAGRKVTARFRLRASESGVQFTCQTDQGPRRACPARFSRRLGIGGHVVRAWATDEAGNVSASPAVFRFRVEKIHRRSHR
jgi:hypothetical protein